MFWKMCNAPKIIYEIIKTCPQFCCLLFHLILTKMQWGRSNVSIFQARKHRLKERWESWPEVTPRKWICIGRARAPPHGPHCLLKLGLQLLSQYRDCLMLRGSSHNIVYLVLAEKKGKEPQSLLTTEETTNCQPWARWFPKLYSVAKLLPP